MKEIPKPHRGLFLRHMPWKLRRHVIIQNGVPVICDELEHEMLQAHHLFVQGYICGMRHYDPPGTSNQDS